MIRYLQGLKVKKGFTIIELIVVIAIMGVLMAVILPAISSERSRINAANSAARDFYAALQTTMSKYSTYDGQLSNMYVNDNNLGIMRYYPLLCGNFPYDKSYPAANTDTENPAIASLYIMVHVENDNIRKVAAVTRAAANTANDPGMFELLKRNDTDRNTEFSKLLTNEIAGRAVLDNGFYYARVDFNYKTSLTGVPEDIKLSSLKVAYTAYTRKELPTASGSYSGFVNSTLTFGSDNKLNTGEICGTCAAWNETTNNRIGMTGTSLT